MASENQQGDDFPAEFSVQQVPPHLGAIVKIGAVILGLVLLFVLLSLARSIYTNWLWYDSLGFNGVYVKILITRIVMFLIGASVFGGLLGVSFYFANRLSRGPVTLPLPSDVVELIQKLVFWGILAVVLILSMIFGLIFASKWEVFLRFANDVPFGQTDPVFGKDVSFYVFTLPMYTFIQGWLLGAAIVVVLATLALYSVNFGLRRIRFALTPALLAHVSIVAAVLMFVIAWGHWLGRWDLVLSDRGVVFGAAYADINARKPALLILTIVASASGILILVNAYLRGLRLLVGATVLWVVLAVALGSVWPSVMQRFTVDPSEFAKESEYIERNLEFTRLGFGLDQIDEQFYSLDTPAITSELIQENLQTVNNIRLWDERPLSAVYKQIQLIRPYYDFKAADVDRYTLNGQYRQVLLSAREVAPEKLAPESQTWVNRKLFYTHGIGVAMSPVTEFTPEGRPEFFAQDIPTGGAIPIGIDSSVAEPEIVVDNARIYYGENTLDPVIVNTETDELDYQTAEGDLFRTKYFGTGGVRLSSYLKRLAYAWEFGDINILISGEITGDSLVQYRRQIQKRISTVAPFLVLDKDPYIVATDDRFFWIQDAYTVTDKFPYSDPAGGPNAATTGGGAGAPQGAAGPAGAPGAQVSAGEANASGQQGSFNYIRNSVKVTVDAYNGSVKFHIWDAADPIVRTYEKMFPKLFVSQNDMPAALREHVRYPQDLFTIQAQKYIRYHMRDPQNFYNNEDLWAFAREKFGETDELQVVEPYYVIMKLPGEEKVEFVQLLPYSPNQRANMVGWLAARSDGDNYGKLVAFNFPKDRQVDGPEQVDARIDNDQDISAWFTLRCSEGSSCIRGNLLVIPVGDSILYAEPVYIQAEGVSFPQLKRVILATEQKVVMEDSLAEAVAKLTSATSPVVSGPGNVEGATAAPPGEPRPTETESSLEAEVESVSDALEGLKENLSAVEEALDRLKALIGGK